MKRLLSSRVHLKKKMCKSPVCHLITILASPKQPLVLKESFPMLRNRDFTQHENGDLRKIIVSVNLRKVGHPTLRKLSTARKGL